MVDISGQATDGITNLHAPTGPYNRVRCIPPGLGDTMQGEQHRWLLVSGRDNISHQLPEIIGSFSGLCKPIQGCSTTENGQRLCSHIYQPERWHSLNTTVQPSPGNLEMVLAKTNNTGGRAPARPTQCSGGLGVQSTKGSVRLDAQPSNVPTNSPLISPTTHRSLCLPSDQTDTLLLQLETRSRSNSNSCLYTQLGSGKGLCQSTMVPDTTMFN